MANILPFAGEVLNTLNANNNLQQQNLANMEMSRFNFAMQQKVWNQQNEYNSPKAQMQRLKDAGLNPYLMYGQGTVGNSTQMSKFEAPQIDMQRHVPNVSAAYSQYQDIQMRQKQIEVADSVAKLNDARRLTEILRPEWLRGIMGLNIAKTVGQGYQNEIGYSKSKQELVNQLQKQWDWSNSTYQTNKMQELKKGSLDVANAAIRNQINSLNRDFEKYSLPFNKSLKELEYKMSKRSYRQQFVRPWVAPVVGAAGSTLKFIK